MAIEANRAARVLRPPKCKATRIVLEHLSATFHLFRRNRLNEEKYKKLSF